MEISNNLFEEIKKYKCISFIGPHGSGKTHYIHTLSTTKKKWYNWYYLDHTNYKHNHLAVFIERHSYNQAHKHNVIVLDNCDSLDIHYKNSIDHILESFDNDMYTIICISTKIIFGKAYKEDYVCVIMDKPSDKHVMDILALSFKKCNIKINKHCYNNKKRYRALIKKLLAYINSNMHRLKLLCEYICNNTDKCIDHTLVLEDMHVISNNNNIKVLLNNNTHPDMVKCCDIYRSANNTSGNKYRDNLTIHTNHDMEHMVNMMELFVVSDHKDIYDDIIPYFRCVMAIRSNIFL